MACLFTKQIVSVYVPNIDSLTNAEGFQTIVEALMKIKHEGTNQPGMS